MRVPVIVIALVALALAVLIGLKRNPTPDAPIPAADGARMDAPETPAIRWNRQSQPQPLPVVEEEKETVRVEPEPEQTSPEAPEEFIVRDSAAIEVRKQMIKQMDLRYLEGSPAKDTPEAKAIQAMLAKRGISRAAVPLCYNIAWNYQHALRTIGDANMALDVVRIDKDKLSRHGYGEVGEDFWQEVLALQPTVPFGIKDYNMPRPGETLLVE